jgi:hypothetical protein
VKRLLTLLALALAAHGSTFFVAKTGSDKNPGTEAQP